MKVLKTTKKPTLKKAEEVEGLSREDQVKEGISKIESILAEYQISFDAEITFNSKGSFPRIIVIDKTLQEEQNNLF